MSKFSYLFNNDLVKKYIKENNMTIESFANFCGLKKEEIEKVVGSKYNVPLYIVVRLSRVTGIPYEDFFIF